MHIPSSLWVLAMALLLALPEQYVWAAGNGAVAAPVSSKGAGSGWGPIFTKRTFVGIALTGSGAFFIKKGFDFHRQADAIYSRYLDALDPEEISLLYQRTTQRDLKSRLSWTFGAVLAASGIHILFGRQLAALHLQLTPPFPGTHPQAQVHGVQVQLFRVF